MFQGKVTRKSNKEPMMNVPVSDGKNTVFTDENGEYCLPGWERTHVLHVGVLTYGHDDWFINIHRHTDESFDFCIDPVETGKDFCFLHCSDTEIIGRGNINWIQFMRETVQKEQAAFFIHTGDICHADGLARHYLLMNRETVWCPVRYVIGNHDFVGKNYGEEMYEQYYGPSWYSFDCGDIHFVALSLMKGEKKSGYQELDQWLWLSEDLKQCAAGKKVIVLCHDACKWDYENYHIQTEDISIDLKQQGLIAWLYGHYHINLLHKRNDVYNICASRPDSGGIDSSSSGIRKVAVSGEYLTSNLILNCEEEEGDEAIWKTKLNGSVEFCTPKMDEDSIYIATNSDDTQQSCGIYRLNKKDGNIQWFFPTAYGIKVNICIDEDRIYAQDTGGITYCVDKEGHERYRIEVSTAGHRYTTLSPCVAGDIMVTGYLNKLCAFHKITGEKVWEKTYRHEPTDTPARIVYDERYHRFIIPGNWYAMLALEEDTGEEVWKQKHHIAWFRSATPLIMDNRIFTAGGGGFGEFDLETGELITEAKTGLKVDCSGAPVYDGELLYYPTASHGVVAVEKETLEIVRYYACGNAKIFTSPYVYGQVQMAEGSPVISGNLIYFTANDGCLYIYEKDTAKLLCKKNIGAPSLVTPIVCGTQVICADVYGNIKCYEVNLEERL